MSHRPEHLASVLHHSIQAVITRGLNDPRIRGLVSVTEVNVAPDFSQADVKISVLPDKNGELAVKGLSHAARHIQKRIGPDLSTRRIPRLNFVLDHTLKKQAELDAIFHRLHEEEQELHT